MLGLLTLAEEAHLTFLPSFRFPSLTRQHARRNPSSRFMEESKTQKHCLMRDLEPRSPDSQAPQTTYLSLSKPVPEIPRQNPGTEETLGEFTRVSFPDLRLVPSGIARGM